MKPIKEIFIERFEIALNAIGLDNPQAAEFIVIPTSEEEKYTTMDNIYRIWFTPAISGVRMSYESVINGLVKEQKKVIPLWIKISKEKDNPVVLEISQRFRKMRDVILRRSDNPNTPFEIVEDTLFEFSASKERLEAIRILFFTRQLSPDLKKIIGDQITYNEVKDNFIEHFEKYKSYPPSYKHLKDRADWNSSLVIDKDFKTNEFSVFANPTTESEISSNLDAETAIKYYIEEGLKHEICGIEIISHVP